MNPGEMARLHARAFAPQRGWSEPEFAALCDAAPVRVFQAAHGFALVRIVAEEAELLTLAVDPEHQRRGIAHGLMQEWMADCPAHTAFLEVAEDNGPAIALYNRCGFATVARRNAYYARGAGARVDALLMKAALTYGRAGQSAP